MFGSKFTLFLTYRLSTNCLKRLSFLCWICFAPITKVSWTFSGSLLLDSIPLISCLSFHQYHIVLITRDLWYTPPIIGSVIPQTSFFFFKIVVAILVPFPFHVKFKSSWLILQNFCCWFYWNYIKFINPYGRENWESSVLSLLVLEKSVSLLRLLEFFVNVFIVLAHRSCLCFVRFIPKYGIFWNCQ